MNINRDSQRSLITTEQLQASLVQKQIKQQSPKSNRLESLDIYRGLTMVGMILVDNSGPHPPWFLDHAQWNGLTPADLIFPSFLFIMGMAVPLAITKNKPINLKNIIRIFALFLIGVFLNLLARKFTFDHFRILGILQRISICYGAMLLIHVSTQYGKLQKRIYAHLTILVCLMIYLIYMLSFENIEIGCTAQNNLESFCNFSAYIDRAIFGQNHMIYPNDPEGLFSNLSAFFTCYIGYSFCLIMKDNKGQIKKTIRNWIIVCFILGLCVYPLTYLMQLNKKIYSISFAFLTSSSSGLTIALMTVLIDILPKKKPHLQKCIQLIFRPFLWLGRNPLFVFVFMDLLAIIMIKLIIIDDRSLWSWFYKICFRSWIDNDYIASVVFACFFLILWTLAAGLLFKKGIFIRI